MSADIVFWHNLHYAVGLHCEQVIMFVMPDGSCYEAVEG
jgi:hypothetical protein